jgi:hypothetical protein
MGPTVGGRIEEDQRPRSLLGPDYLRLACLVLVAAAVHGWLIAHTAMTARDSLGFARQALCFGMPSAAPPHEDGRPKTFIDHVRSAEQHPGYPLAVWVTHAGLRRALPDMPVPDRALLATQLANAFAAVLLVVPVYLTGRMLFGRNTGFAAALLFQVLPVPAKITSDGLSEGVYLLATGVAVALGVRAVRVPRISGFLLCGMATGASYVVRPEGLMMAAGPAAVALWLGLTRRWPRDQALARLTALAVGVALVSVPYMAVIGKLTNKPNPNQMLNPTGPNHPFYHSSETSQRPALAAPLFAAWWNDEVHAGRSRGLWAAQAVVKEASKAANYVVWPLAIFAVLAMRRRFASEPGLWVPAVLAACNVALLVCFAYRAGYVSERHTMLLTLFACLFAAAGLPLFAAAIGQLLPSVERLGVRVTAASLLVALVASSLPFALKSMHPNREGHKHAGRWLAAHMTGNDALRDPFCWAEWYAGRTLYRTSWNPPTSRNTYVIWETGPSPHSRLPEYENAKEALKHPTARIAYHWPENVPPEQAAVQVWKLGPE